MTALNKNGTFALKNRIKNLFSGITIRARITLTFGLFTLVLVAALARVAYMTSKEIYQAQLQDQVQRVCALLAADFEADYFSYIQADAVSKAYRYIETKLKSRRRAQELDNVFIFSADFSRIYAAAAGISAERLQINRSEIQSLDSGESAASLPFKAADGNWYLWGFYRFNGDWYLGIQESARQLAMLDRLTYTFLGIGFLGVIFVLLAAWLLSGAISRPIEELVRFSARIGQGQFYEQPPQDIRGELAVLSGALVKMQKDLRRKQKEKEEILAQIAHEIRNPLGGIELLAGLLMEDKNLNKQQRTYLYKIQEEVLGLKAQITDYLQYSRPMPADPVPVDVPSVVNEAEQALLSSLRKKNIRLEKRLNTSTIRFDRQHLLQILINLFSNSVEALNKDGKIIVASDAEGIYVQDNGPGINEEIKEKVFRPFFTTKKGGAGLGLAVCRKLAEENDARLELHNHQNGGVVFHLKILHSRYTQTKGLNHAQNRSHT